MIEINNNTRGKIDIEYLKKNINKILNILGLNGKYISFAFVSKKDIHELNLTYRGKNKETDVLSFPFVFRDEIWNFNDNIEENELGEIIICYDVVKEQAKKFKKSAKEEALFLCAHGILHLLGFEDEKTNEEWLNMERWQNYICNKINIRNY